MTDKNRTENGLPREKTDLFLENNMDEMLRYKNYEMGYKIFGKYFSAVYAVSMIIAIIGGIIKDVPLMAAGLLLTAFTAVFRTVYAAKSASQGIMNPTFTERLLKGLGKSYIFLQICFVLMFLAFLISAVGSDKPYVYISISAVGIISVITSVLEYFFAKKNMKVLEEMLKDESED